MFDQIALSNNATKGSGKQSFQSAWMAHWMKTNHSAAAEIRTATRNEELDSARRDASFLNQLEVPKSVKGAGVLETKSFNILNDSQRTGSKNSGNEGMHCSLLKLGKDTDEVRTLFSRDVECGKGMISNNGIQFLPMNSEIPTANGTSSRGYHSRGGGTSKNPLGWMKTHPPSVGSSFAASKPVQQLFVESSTCIVPYRFDIGKCEVDKGKAAIISPLMGRSAVFSNNLPDAKMRMLEQGNCHNGLELADLACDRRKNSYLQLNNPPHACFRETKPSLFSEAPSTSDHHLAQFNRGWFQNMHKCSSLGLFPVQSIASEETKAKKSHCNPYSLQKFPDCVHDVETMRICTMVDSVVGMPAGCPMFAQTTHSLLITKKTDANLSKENETLRSTRVTEIDEKACSEPCGPSSFFSQGNRGLKLQALSSSCKNEGKGNVGDVKVFEVTRRNDSSAETDTLDMDSLNEKIPHTGTNSTTSTTKGIIMESSLPPRIPDTNLKPRGLPVPASLSVNMGPTSSRTQSLEMDMLLAHTEQLKPMFNLNLEYSTKADANNIWVKRLKLNSLSAQSTKTSNLGENLPHEKLNKYASTILKNNFTSSEPSLSKHHGKESLDKDCDLSKEDKDLPVDLAKKPHGLPVPASLSVNMGPTSTRTQSLEMDMLLAHAEQPKPMFNLNLEYSTKADANNIWVKRLKLNSLSAQRTKTSNLGENLPHKKLNKYVSTILKNNFTSSEPSLSKHHGHESLDKDHDLSKEDKDLPVDLSKKDVKLVLSHAWIQRWLSNESRVAQKNPGEMVAREPLSSKLELEDLEKKQFPSIAAMALMGKVMSGFQQYELQKRGSFTVWNTKTFREHL